MIRPLLSKLLCVASQEGLENFIELLQISMYNARLRCLEMLFSVAKRSKILLICTTKVVLQYKASLIAVK
ncbi:MAG: hypothetical protein LBE51_05460 [Acidovorax sp.]|jgi:ATP-dependent protease HslVU (ClpYQ) peptidase subunit|nr:hypothetical protein [Acidovorax sp.]